MEKLTKKWKVLDDSHDPDILRTLLKNRNIKTKEQIKDFFNPKNPNMLSLKEIGIEQKEINKSIKRIEKALKTKEDVVVYGDYDADGICSTAILWETLYSYTNKVTPYLPDRFTEGYGINPTSIEKIKSENPKLSLIITVDNGIVAFDAIDKANELGIDVIITDHHQKDSKLPNAYSIVHTDKTSGSGVAYFFAREIDAKLKNIKIKKQKNNLELAAIGTIADQLPLIGPNRSIAKYGLKDLANTKRVGLKELFKESSITNGSESSRPIGTYEVNYLIAPRLNAMGRLKHAMDSLRLLCTTSTEKANGLASHIGRVNRERQKVVDNVLKKAEKDLETDSGGGVIVISGDYHEGVIGLAAGKITEKFGRPAIVVSKGVEISKASARSIAGFNIVEEIKKHSSLLLGAGGHPMAAGFSLATNKIDKFKKEIQKSSSKLLTEELLKPTLKIDTVLEFVQINWNLLDQINKFEPFGIGNFAPVFLTRGVVVSNAKTVGSDRKHLKIGFTRGDIKFDAIAFNFATQQLNVGETVDIVYSIEENMWNGIKNLQLKVKDIKLT